jgi:phage FluMu protein Com
MMVKIRCTTCGHRLPIDHFDGVVWVYCRNCKQVIKLDNRETAPVG